ncbi:MAG: hypothetical protein KatS3mg027_2224 [Bacteroidia bacterium]|nr:MAG: hypothetical protein KatS3mg027_2224 [Bacteroidia bacterium]
MKLKFVTLLFFIYQFILSQNKPIIYWDTYLFHLPYQTNKNNCFAEISLSIAPYNLNVQKNKDSSFFVTIKGTIEIYADSKLFKKDSFIVKSPSARKLEELQYFGYLKRYWLENFKNYTISVHIKDYFTKDTSFTYHSQKNIQTNFKHDSIQFSSIQFIDVIEKSEKQDMYYKHGYTIVPYNDNYFNENFDQLKFLAEIYYADTILGKNEPYVVNYKIIDKDNNKILENYGGFKKLNASKVNVLITSMPIKDLPSGNYYLLLEVRNKNNILIRQQKIFFQRKSYTAKKKLSVDEELFFGNQNNLDTLKMWTESLWPIANQLEKEWIINQSINKDVQMMKNFMIDFWYKRSADTASPVELAKKYYSLLNYVMKNFKCGKMAPYNTDRGRVYLQYGEPNQRVIQLSEPGAYPYEIWQYYRIYDASTNQFFSNRRFVFVNKGIADECYTLIHSDMRGEYNNPNWQREIMKHDPYNINDPYQQQKLNYGNNFDKLYQNPQ